MIFFIVDVLKHGSVVYELAFKVCTVYLFVVVNFILNNLKPCILQFIVKVDLLVYIIYICHVYLFIIFFK